MVPGNLEEQNQRACSLLLLVFAVVLAANTASHKAVFMPTCSARKTSVFSYRWEFERIRCLEIKEWLKQNPDVTHWVAVDDLNMSNENLHPGLDNFVLTPRPNEGIKQSGIKEKILKHLL